jgi:hypothetical protein
LVDSDQPDGDRVDVGTGQEAATSE